MKKKVKILIIVGIILAILIVCVVLYLFVFKQNLGFNLPSLDYSAGTNIGDNIGKATDLNAFDKLNPFR